MTLRAAQVLLKKYGIRTSYVRNREGWRAWEGDVGEVKVSADFNSAAEAREAVDELAKALTADGVAFYRRSTNSVVLT